MQFIESTIFGVRSAYWKLSCNSDMPIIHVFPMVHIADREFYEAVLKKLSDSDVILVEGVKTKTTRLLSYSYRNAIKNPKLGMVLQPKILQTEVRGKIIHSDVSSSDFRKQWKALGLFTKLKLLTLFPAYGVYLRYFGSREKIARGMNTEDIIGRDEILDDDTSWEEAKEVILDWRDSYLLKKLDEQIEKPENSQANIAVVYGALHMRSVVTYLTRVKGYHVESSEWLSVVKL